MSRKTHRHLLPSVRDALATELRAMRAAYGGTLPTPLVEQFARQYDLSTRSVHRLAADPGAVPAPRTKFKLTDELIAVVANSPNRKKAWSDLVANGSCTVGYPQFTRACKVEDPAVFEGSLGGTAAMTAKQAYLLCESAHRNDMWIIDHYEVPVWVRWPKFRNPVKPWQTTLMDDKHRTVMGAIWWPKQPTAQQAVAAVAAAVRGFTLPDDSFVGGAPHILLMDQGAELIGEEAARAYLAMRIDPQVAPARAPWVKGKLETFHGNVLDPGYAAFPGRTDGPVDSAGRQILSTPTADLLHRDEFRSRAWAMLAEYNVGHQHSALGGASPLESWLTDNGPVRPIADALLRPYWLTEQRTISGKGVHMHTRPYQEPRFTHEGGRVLEIRYVPDDETFVDVLLPSGQWARAVPHPLPPTMASELLRRRAAQSHRVAAIHKLARQLAADAHADAASAPAAPAPAAGPPPAIDPVPADGARPSTEAPASAVVAPAAAVRPVRRSTNTRGGGPKPDPEPSPAPAHAHAPLTSRIRPLRSARPDSDATS